MNKNNNNNRRLTKAQFLSKPKIKKLPPAEQNRRWQQHLNSSTQQSSQSRVKQRPGNGTRRTGGKLIPKCTIDYLRILTDPFNCQDLTVCIPDLNTSDSFKNISTLRGVMTCNAVAGFGFVYLNPKHVCYDVVSAYPSWRTGGAMTFPPVMVTDGSGATQSINNPFSDAGVALPSAAQKLWTTGTNYAASTFMMDAWGNPTVSTFNRVRARLVGAGLRIRYIGREDALAGLVTVLRQPDNDSIPPIVAAGTPATFDDISGQATSATFPVSRDWATVCWRPMSDEDTEYSGNPLTLTNHQYDAADTLGIESSPKYSMICCVSGCPGGTFEYQAVQYVEYIGRTIAKTRTHSDIAGISAIRNILPDSPPPISTTQYFSEMAQKLFTEYSGDVMTGLGAVVSNPVLRNAARYQLGL